MVVVRIRRNRLPVRLRFGRVHLVGGDDHRLRALADLAGEFGFVRVVPRLRVEFEPLREDHLFHPVFVDAERGHLLGELLLDRGVRAVVARLELFETLLQHVEVPLVEFLL